MNTVILKYHFCLLIVGMLFFNVHAQEIMIEKLPFNSSLKNDFAPFVHDSVIYFTSNRKHEIVKTYLDQNNEGLYRLYKAPILINDEIGRESLLKPDELSKLNVASICYSFDGKEIFITQNQYTTIKKSKGRENLLGIFMIENSNGTWSKPISFNYNSKRQYSTGQPTLSKDGETMFFVSNMSDGFGKTDIYQSKLVNGIWSEPKNLGKVINTEGSELFPFYHPSGRLYFSSDSHNSMGGLDIFYTISEGDGWSTPLPLEEPINSSYDDFSCYIDSSIDGGFFASSREGVDNIYRFSNPFPSFPDAKEQVEDNFCFTIYEDGPFISDSLPYVYQWNFGDGQTAQGLEVDHCFSKPGLYDIHLNVVDTLANIDLYTVANYQINLELTQQIYILAPDTIRINEEVNLSAEKSVLKDFIPKQYYWTFGDNNKGKGVTVRHVFRTKGIYMITCGAISKDDATNKMSSRKQMVVIE